MIKRPLRRALVGAALAALCVAALAGARPARAQSLLGQSVNDSAYYPNQQGGTTIQDNGTQAVTASSVTFNDTAETTTDAVTPTQIIITQELSGGYIPGSFNGIVFTETGPSPVAITGATLDSSSTFAPVGITFTSDSVSVNFAGLNVDSVGQFTTIDLSFAPVSSTPEPSAWLAFGLGAMGLGALALRAKKRATGAA